jgi:hypothetical protein
MEHFDLEDMFGRRRKPRLAFHCEFVRAGDSGGGGQTAFKGRLVVGIENSGRGIAKAPYLQLNVSAPYHVDRYGVDGNGHEGLPRLVHAGPSGLARYGASADTVIHTGVTLEVASIELNAIAYSDGRIELPRAIDIEFMIAAEGVAPVHGRYGLSSEELAAKLFPPHLYAVPAGG